VKESNVHGSLRRLVIAALAFFAVGATVGVVFPAVGSACAPGETGVTNGCAPFCLPGRALDLNTGLCTPAPPPPPPLRGQ
jgi:hypothetical protein